MNLLEDDFIPVGRTMKLCKAKVIEMNTAIGRSNLFNDTVIAK